MNAWHIHAINTSAHNAISIYKCMPGSKIDGYAWIYVHMSYRFHGALTEKVRDGSQNPHSEYGTVPGTYQYTET